MGAVLRNRPRRRKAQTPCGVVLFWREIRQRS
jgi:hypothetical protein